MSDLYEIEPRPLPPALPGTVMLRQEVDEAIDAIAADILIHAHNCVRTFGDFHLALSGGSTPVPLYQRLMIDPRYRELPWKRTHLWIVDERRVPFEDERSNFRMIGELIGEHSGIPREQVHPMFAMAEDADVQYQRTLREVLGWREKGHDRLDCVILGMGSDAHTASLFPHSPALKVSLKAPMFTGRTMDESEPVPLVAINAGPEVTPPDRVTMMLPLINASRYIGVLVTGASKRATLERVARGAAQIRAAEDAAARTRTIESLPILGVRPLGGELRWYMDYAACPGAPERQS